MGRKRMRRPGGGGAEGERIGLSTRDEYTAWRHWARLSEVDRLTACQRQAAQLLAAGIADTPESALALLEAGEEAV